VKAPRGVRVSLWSLFSLLKSLVISGNIPLAKKNLTLKGTFMKNIFSRTFKVSIWLIFISGLLANQSAFPQSKAPIQIGENSRSIISGNQTRQYLLYIPAEYEGKTPLPLVLLFYGTGGSSKAVMELTELRKVAEIKKFIIAAPDGIYSYLGGNSWNADLDPAGVNDVEFIKDLVREVSSKVTIDKQRIYTAGFSAGARISSRLACDLSKTIAAVGAVAGLKFPGNCSPARPVPVITFFGTEDRINTGGEVFASAWAENNDCKKDPKTIKISNDVNQMTYVECKNNAEVVIYRINGGGHIWPDSPMSDHWEKMGIWRAKEINKEINATNLIWGFFESHPMP